PPLSGFLGKFAILAPLFGPGEAGPTTATWTLLTVLLLSSMATIIAVARAGIDAFWTSPAEMAPSVRLTEIIPVGFLLLLCLALTAQAGPVMRYMDATAQSLHAPQGYIRGVLGDLPAAGTEAGR